MPMTLGYWNLTHPIRLLLEYTDSSYEEKRYVMGDAPNFDRSQWLSEKFILGLDIPNLPYLIDGPHKITQSNAILRYIARKHNLCGETEQERIRVDTLENQVMDTRIHLMIVCCNPDFLTHPIRLLLEYTDSSYEEKRYTMGDAPDFDRSQWLNEKFKLGLDFPNLPYLIDGSHKITQSNAILRYIARKHNLCGETEQERIRADIVENQVMDTRMQLIMLCYSPDFEKQKPEFLKSIPEKMKLYSEFLGKRPWFAGDKITYVDFLAYDILDQYRLLEPKCLDAFPNLKDFLARFEGLKKISAYMKTSRFLPTPIFSKMAHWCNK